MVSNTAIYLLIRSNNTQSTDVPCGIRSKCENPEMTNSNLVQKNLGVPHALHGLCLLMFPSPSSAAKADISNEINSIVV